MTKQGLIHFSCSPKEPSPSPPLPKISLLSDSSLKARFKNLFSLRRLYLSMEVEERKIASGYAKPPWIFKGSALYQIHLVKAETARSFIPKEFRLVEAFGYTLGGFFLASYDDSPAGVFDELVVIAGIVWNPPTSCAWAARVLVNSNDACDHGRKEVGLPSQVARFSKKITAVSKPKRNGAFGFLDTFGLGTTQSHPEDLVEMKVSEVDSAASADICNIQIRSDESETKLGNWLGPAIRMSLPSFSGNTKFNSNLLKYSCHLHCRVRPVRPAVVSGGSLEEVERKQESLENENENENERQLSIAVMLSKPIIALQFKCLTMQVEAPVVVV